MPTFRDLCEQLASVRAGVELGARHITSLLECCDLLGSSLDRLRPYVRDEAKDTLADLATRAAVAGDIEAVSALDSLAAMGIGATDAGAVVA